MHRHEMQQSQLFIYFKNFLEFCFHVKIRVLETSKTCLSWCQQSPGRALCGGGGSSTRWGEVKVDDGDAWEDCLRGGCGMRRTKLR
jgi:hypothetical protein